MPFYKVVRGEVLNGAKKALSSKVVWEGTDLGELANKFPRKYFTNGNTMDDLRGIRTPKSVIVTAFLARENESDQWGIIPDPRPIIGAVPHGRSVVVRM